MKTQSKYYVVAFPATYNEETHRFTRDVSEYRKYFESGLEPAGGYDEEPKQLQKGSITKAGVAALALFRDDVSVNKDGEMEVTTEEVKGAKLSEKALFVTDRNGYLCDAELDDITDRIYSHICVKGSVNSAFCAAEIIADKVTERILAPFVDTLPETSKAERFERLEKVTRFISKTLLREGAIKIKRGRYATGTKARKFINFVDDEITRFIKQLQEAKEEKKNAHQPASLKRAATDYALDYYRKHPEEFKDGSVFVLCGDKKVGLTEDENALCFALSALINEYQRESTIKLNVDITKRDLEASLKILGEDKEDRQLRKKISAEIERLNCRESEFELIKKLTVNRTNGDYISVTATFQDHLALLFGKKSKDSDIEWLTDIIKGFKEKECLRVYQNGENKEERWCKTIRIIPSSGVGIVSPKDAIRENNYSIESMKNLKQNQCVADLEEFMQLYQYELTHDRRKDLKYEISIAKSVLLLPEEQGKGKFEGSHNELPHEVLKYIYGNAKSETTASKVFGWARQLIRAKNNTEETRVAVGIDKIGYNDRSSDYRHLPLLKSALETDGYILELSDGQFIVTKPKKIDN